MTRRVWLLRVTRLDGHRRAKASRIFTQATAARRQAERWRAAGYEVRVERSRGRVEFDQAASS